MSDELKACPFCGDPSAIDFDDTMLHPNKSCPAYGIHKVTIWNTRTAPVTKEPMDLEALRAELHWFAKFIVDQKDSKFYGDHACFDCFPNSELVRDGFVCAYHRARLYLNERSAS